MELGKNDANTHKKEKINTKKHRKENHDKKKLSCE